MDDMISRQAAIDALMEMVYLVDGYYFENVEVIDKDDAIETITALPSAQPDFDEWCTDCKEYDKEKHCCSRFNRVIREALKDVQQKIIYCKDCVKHNIGVDDTPYKSYVCPLVKFRGKAQGHEFDYQYCVYGARKI